MGGVSATDAASPVCFIAVNETLLDLGSMPYTYGGITYVPYWVYSNFGVYYSYYSESSTATLYSADRQIYFDLANGNSYDGYNKRYAAQAIFRGGAVYVPVTFVSIYFGLVSNFVLGKGYGDFKSEVAEAVIDELAPIRERYKQLIADPAELDRLLALGAEKARAVAEPKVELVKARVGFIPSTDG